MDLPGTIGGCLTFNMGLIAGTVIQGCLAVTSQFQFGGSFTNNKAEQTVHTPGIGVGATVLLSDGSNLLDQNGPFTCAAGSALIYQAGACAGYGECAKKAVTDVNFGLGLGWPPLPGYGYVTNTNTNTNVLLGKQGC
jgi:hypothetical protein